MFLRTRLSADPAGSRFTNRRMRLSSYKNTVLILVYHSTSYSLSETKSLVTALDKQITKIIEGEESVILLGDFNLPDLNWDESVINSPTDTTDIKFLRQKLFWTFF